MSKPAPGITELVERLEKATGPDRDLNAALLLWAGWRQDASGVYDPDGNRALSIPDFTASVDAALALIERVLKPAHPHMTVSVRQYIDPHPSARAEITWPSSERLAHHRTPALALCLALLRALPTIEGEER